MGGSNSNNRGAAAALTHTSIYALAHLCTHAQTVENICLNTRMHTTYTHLYSRMVYKCIPIYTHVYLLIRSHSYTRIHSHTHSLHTAATATRVRSRCSHCTLPPSPLMLLLLQIDSPPTRSTSIAANYPPLPLLPLCSLCDATASLATPSPSFAAAAAAAVAALKYAPSRKCAPSDSTAVAPAGNAHCPMLLPLLKYVEHTI